MNASKHTPGPWRTDERYIYFGCAPDGGNADGILATVGNPYDNQGHNIDPDKYECAANARLIAAAPELLEACRAVLDTLDRNNVPTPCYLRRDESTLRDAIAAATGEKA